MRMVMSLLLLGLATSINGSAPASSTNNLDKYDAELFRMVGFHSFHYDRNHQEVFISALSLLHKRRYHAEKIVLLKEQNERLKKIEELLVAQQLVLQGNRSLEGQEPGAQK